MLDHLDGLPLDLPEAAQAALTEAGALWHSEAEAEAKVLEALALAPDALAIDAAIELELPLQPILRLV